MAAGTNCQAPMIATASPNRIGASSKRSSPRNWSHSFPRSRCTRRAAAFDIVVAEALPLGPGDLAEMGDPPPRQRMGGVELDERGPRIVSVEQHCLGGGAGTL